MIDLSDAHKSIFNANSLPDERSFGVFNMLKDVYPAFADKLFEGNSLMRNLIMSGYNPMDILDYPICGKCETISPYSGYAKKNGKIVQKCTCMKDKCARTTIDPITLRVWLREEMKKKVSEDFYEAIEYAIDGIAASLMLKQVKDAKAIMQEKQSKDSEMLGIIMSDGTTHNFKAKESVEHLRYGEPEMPEDAIILNDEMED